MSSVIHATAHGLTAGSPFRFANLVPADAGPDETATYYVLAAGLTANQFEFSATLAGTPFVLTHAITDGSLVSGDTYEVVSDGVMDAPPTPATPTGLALTSLVTLDSDGHAGVRLDITIAAATDPQTRSTWVTVQGPTGQPVIVSFAPNETHASIPGVYGATLYSATAVAYDVYGNASAATAPVTHTTVADTTAPSTPTGFAVAGMIHAIIASWTAVTAADLAYYEIALSSDAGATYPTTFRSLTTAFYVGSLSSGTYYAKVRAVDRSGNASAYCAAGHADAREVSSADIASGAIDSVAKFAATLHPPVIVGALPTLPDGSYPIGSLVVLTTDGKLYRNVANVWTTAIAGADVSGAVALATSAATSAGIPVVGALPTLPNATYPQGALVLLSTTGKLYRNTDGSTWSVATDGADITALSITAAQIAAGTITGAKIAATTIAAGNIVALTITAAQIAANTITAAKIAAGTITATEIATDTITAGNIASGAIGTSELAVGARLTGELANESGLTPGVFIDSTGILIRSGKLTLQDENGTSVMTSTGFSGAWSSFIALGVYNAQFGAGIAGAVVAGRTSALPYWTVAQPDGASGALTYEAGPPADVKATWGAISKRWSLTSDKVPVNANRFYEFGTYVTVNAPTTVEVDVAIQLNWYKVDGTASAITPTVGPFASAFIGGITSNTRLATGAAAPSDAAFASIVFTAKEVTTHDAAAYCKFLLTWLSVTADTFSDISAASLSVAGSVSGPTAIFGAAQITGLFETDALNKHGGTSFPGSPATGNQFYRTDYHRWYYYDGTRWLSVEEFTDHITPNEAAQPWSVTNAFRWGGWQGLTGVTDLWITSINSTYFVASGGTALDASNKWVTTYAGMLGALAGTSQTIASGSSNVWRSGAVLVGALLGTSEVGLNFTTTKTGTPGTLRQITRINYRLVAV